jgi:phosphohistidine phosphatase SixA
VRVVETRDHCALVEIDKARAWSAIRHDVSLGAHRENPAVLDRDGRRVRLAGIQGLHPAVAPERTTLSVPSRVMGAGRCGAAGLRAVVPAIDVLAASPLLRAVQTAEILAAVYNGRNMVTVKDLSPDSEFPPFLRWLRTQDAGGTVAIVGHEPHLSGLTSWLLTGRKRSFISLKKGAACLLEFGEQPKAGAGDARVGTRPVPASATRRIGVDFPVPTYPKPCNLRDQQKSLKECWNR